MASFYADENFRHPVVEELRKLGHDVLTAQEAGRAGHGIEDEDVLDDARTMSRILSNDPGRPGLSSLAKLACSSWNEASGGCARPLLPSGFRPDNIEYDALTMRSPEDL